MIKKLIFFSNNKNKINEISKLFKGTSLNIVNLNYFNKFDSPKEIGKTFAENAKIKSTYGFINFKYPCFADDSGICIDAMKDKPGVYSKNFLNKNNNPMNALNKILHITKEKNNYKAFFQTAICLTLSVDRHLYFNGIIKGCISDIYKGKNGFGYDPIFIPENYKQTFAEMDLDQKNKISHRSLAIKKLKDFLIKSI